jgi:hypothetical protein
MYSLLSTGVLCSRLQRATIADVVRIQSDLLKMGMLMLEYDEYSSVTIYTAASVVQR